MFILFSLIWYINLSRFYWILLDTLLLHTQTLVFCCFSSRKYTKLWAAGVQRRHALAFHFLSMHFCKTDMEHLCTGAISVGSTSATQTDCLLHNNCGETLRICGSFHWQTHCCNSVWWLQFHFWEKTPCDSESLHRSKFYEWKCASDFVSKETRLWKQKSWASFMLPCEQDPQTVTVWAKSHWGFARADINRLW